MTTNLSLSADWYTNVLLWLYLFCAFMFFESGITVSRLHRKASLNRTASAALFLMSMYSLVYGLFLAAAGPGEAAVLFRILWTVTFLAVAVMLHFCLEFAHAERLLRNVAFMTAVYIVPIIMNFALMFGFIGSFDFVRSSWGWDAADHQPVIMTANLPYMLMLAYSLAGFVSILVRSVKTNNPTEKRQAWSIARFTSLSFACILIPYSAVLLAGRNPSGEDAILYGNLAVITFLLIWLTGLRYTMKKYRLLVILPDEPVEDVFNAIDTGMILLGRDNNVLFANGEASRIFSADAGNGSDMTGKRFDDLIDDPRIFLETTDALRSRSFPHGSFSAIQPKIANAGALLSLEVFPMFDDGDTYAGCVLMALPEKRLKELEGLRERFSISDREKEIVLLLARGLSNKEIADKLFISPGTVKNHVYNIYEKTGVKNRVELTRLLE